MRMRGREGRERKGKGEVTLGAEELGGKNLNLITASSASWFAQQVCTWVGGWVGFRGSGFGVRVRVRVRVRRPKVPSLLCGFCFALAHLTRLALS